MRRAAHLGCGRDDVNIAHFAQSLLQLREAVGMYAVVVCQKNPNHDFSRAPLHLNARNNSSEPETRARCHTQSNFLLSHSANVVQSTRRKPRLPLALRQPNEPWPISISPSFSPSAKISSSMPLPAFESSSTRTFTLTSCLLSTAIPASSLHNPPALRGLCEHLSALRG